MMLSAIIVLAVVLVLLFLYLHLYLRWRLRRLASIRRLAFASAPTDAGHGIDTDTLKSLPTLSYTRAEEGEGTVECAVCISEMEEGEKVRILPRCGHCFHIECIDMWFHSHAKCPVCRSAVEPMENLVPMQAAPPPLQPLSLIGSSSAGSGATDRDAVQERVQVAEEVN